MRLFWFLALMGLAACNGGTTDTSDTNTGSDDTGLDPNEYATINIVGTFLGADVDCIVMVDGVQAGYTGEDIVVTANHTHTIGVGVDVGNGLYAHTLDDTWSGDPIWAGANVFTPTITDSFDPDEVVDEDRELNLLPYHSNDWWSCANDRNDSLDKGIATIEGDQIDMLKGWMTINGTTLSADGYANASFTSIATASFDLVFSDDNIIHYSCSSSDADGNPVTPSEEGE